MSPSDWIVKSPVSSKNGGIDTLALRIAKRTTRPSWAVNLIAMTVLPTAMVWLTARPVVLICSSTSPPSEGTPGSPVLASTVTRSTPAMPSGEKMKPPCPSVRPTPCTVAVTSDTATRMALGAGMVSPGFGSTRVICSKAKLPDSTKGTDTDASTKVMPRDRKPDRRRNGPFCRLSVVVSLLAPVTKVSLTTALVVLISTARLPLIEMLALLPLMVVL